MQVWRRCAKKKSARKYGNWYQKNVIQLWMKIICYLSTWKSTRENVYKGNADMFVHSYWIGFHSFIQAQYKHRNGCLKFILKINEHNNKCNVRYVFYCLFVFTLLRLTSHSDAGVRSNRLYIVFILGHIKIYFYFYSFKTEEFL